jgi:biopolymer transport protein ExbD
MALKKKRLPEEINLNLVPMIDITSFILLALAILVMSMKKEASLDNILKLPPILHASKQDQTLMQIYILPAVIGPGGAINPDSTGLVAFMGKSRPPDACPNCQLPFRDINKNYIPGALLDGSGNPVASLGSAVTEEEQKKVSKERPPSYWCSRCRFEISPYVKLDEIPSLLKQKKKEVLDQMVATENFSRLRKQEAPMTSDQIKRMEDDIPLLIKADEQSFYGRILQVVFTAQSKDCDIKKFAFVTLPEASMQVQKAKERQDKLKEKQNRK